MSEGNGPSNLHDLLDSVLAIGSDLDLSTVLGRIVQSAVDLVDAQYGALGVLDVSRTRLSDFITVGIDEEQRRLIGPLPDGHGILGLLIVDARPLRLPDLTLHPESYGFPPNHPPMTSFLGVPVMVRGRVFGNLYLTDKRGAAEFSAADEELLIGLAAAAGVAIENARLHARVHELAVTEDRERIARDLHDTVIQRLFACGMTLQSTIRLVEADPAAAVARIESAVDELDLTVKQIRTAIFGMEQSRTSPDGLRSSILSLVHEAAGGLGFEPRILFDGPIDTAVSDEVGAELLATMREALSNVARHARAGRVEIEVLVGGEVTLRVIDDGVGPPSPDTPRGDGLRNMEARALQLGGTLDLGRNEPTGTVLHWQVPKA